MSYEVWLCSDVGTPLFPFDIKLLSLEFVRRRGAAGAFALVYSGELERSFVKRDRQIRVWRRVEEGPLRLIFTGLLRYARFDSSANSTTTTLAGPHISELLDRRIIAYAAGTTRATASGPADDEMKDVINENFAAGATDSTRSLASFGFTITSDLSAASNIDMAFAWRDVRRVLNDMSNVAYTLDDQRLYYWLEATSIDPTTHLATLEFVTSLGLAGKDRTWNTANPVIFGTSWGNVENASLELDWRNEITFVYAGGQGEGSNRIIKTASDDARIAASVWGRIEKFVDARNEADPDAVQAIADAELAKGRPVARFEATVVDTTQTRYLRDWDLGDRVTIQELGVQFDGDILVVSTKLVGGRETLGTKVQGEIEEDE